MNKVKANQIGENVRRKNQKIEGMKLVFNEAEF